MNRAHAPVTVMSRRRSLFTISTLPQPFSHARSQMPMRLHADAVIRRGFGCSGSGPAARQMERMVSLWSFSVAAAPTTPSLDDAVADLVSISGSQTNTLPLSSPACVRGMSSTCCV